MNSLNFTGFIGHDAETRFTPKGLAIVSCNVALSSGFGKSSNTTWLKCSIFGKRGEAVAQYLKKGSQVGIEGEFSARPYTNKNGDEKLSLEVRVNSITLLGRKETAPDPENYDDPRNYGSDIDEDIPF